MNGFGQLKADLRRREAECFRLHQVALLGQRMHRAGTEEELVWILNDEMEQWPAIARVEIIFGSQVEPGAESGAGGAGLHRDRAVPLGESESGPVILRFFLRAGHFGEEDELCLTHVASFYGMAVTAVRRHLAAEAARTRAEEASRSRRAFLAMIGHEIRTPLNGLLATAELLKETPLDAEQREYLDILLSSGEALRVILNDTLDFAKIDAGRLTVELIPVNVPKLLAETVQLFESQASQKNLHVALEIDGTVPELVMTDATRLRQIASNLMSNALKFTDRGYVAIAASATEVDGSQGLQVSVADSGIGIPAARMERIFDPFRQADETTTRRFGGTGLGLSISRMLARLLGGDLWVESEEGHGSTFHFTIKAEVAEAATPVSKNTSAGKVRGMRVLIAEDNPVNRLVLGRMLQRLGVLFDTVNDGRAAIEAAEKGGRYDALLMDLHMPEMDGLETCRYLRNRGYRQPIFAVTASMEAEIARTCELAGFTGMLSKPVSLAQVSALLEPYAVDSGGRG